MIAGVGGFIRGFKCPQLKPGQTHRFAPTTLVLMQKIRRALTTLLMLTALLSGCSSYRPAPDAAPAQQSFDLSNPGWVKEVLYSQYDEWRSVKYRAGGLSKSGVDCSGFVLLTYNSRFSIKLPRSTDEQVGIGSEISQSKLVPGDLVFFRTGKATRHVGIFIEDRKFLHASTEKGVMISSLDDQYWARTYWKSVRVPVSNTRLGAR